jgi:hypothetical protein
LAFRTFGIPAFDIVKVVILAFGIWAFCIWAFGIWAFGIRAFGIRAFGIWAFGIRAFDIATLYHFVTAWLGPGLPDGIFSYQNAQFWYVLEGLGW